MVFELNKIYEGDIRQLAAQLESDSVDCIVTSPPYWSLRNYDDVEGQLGLERTPEEFINVLGDVFDHLKRALRPDGNLWVNIGETYWGGKGQSGSDRKDRTAEPQSLQSEASKIGKKGWTKPSDGKHPIIKPKDMVGIPWMLAFELRRRGWWLRSENIWFKENGIPDSATDRTTRSHEHVFHLTKSRRYYYDAYAIATPYAEKSKTVWGSKRKARPGGNPGMEKGARFDATVPECKPRQWKGKEGEVLENRANRRSVWNFGVRKTSGNHSAVYPETIPALCIAAGCKPGGIVLDPFMGDGTTAIAAKLSGRHYLGFEINPKSIANCEKRLASTLGLFYQ